MGDGDNTVALIDSVTWENLGLGPNSLAVALPVYTSGGCGIDEVDILVNDGQTFTSKLPADTARPVFSLGQTMIHEFGHAVGMGHFDTVIDVMNSNYPFAGDLARVYRIPYVSRRVRH
jgi:hypothetical protein